MRKIAGLLLTLILLSSSAGCLADEIQEELEDQMKNLNKSSLKVFFERKYYTNNNNSRNYICLFFNCNIKLWRFFKIC